MGPRGFQRRLLAPLLLLVLAAGHAHAQSAPRRALAAAAPANGTDSSGGMDVVLAALGKGQEQKVLVTFNTAAQQQPGARAASVSSDAASADPADQRAGFAAAKARVFGPGGAAATMSGGSGGGGARLARDYSELPVALASVRSVAALRALEAHPAVSGVFPDKLFHKSMARALPFIDQPAAVAEGFTGQGCAIAVLDTGLDYTNPVFGPCTAPGVPADSCRVPFMMEFAQPYDNVPDDDWEQHGTMVSAIAAQTAPGAKLLGLDVFFLSATGLSARESDYIAAINWAVANKDAHNICAINLSLGAAQQFTSPCSASPSEAAMAAARAAGLLTVVAAGNEKFKKGLTEPACAPSALSAGAVYDADFGKNKLGGLCTDSKTAPDLVTCYSNRAPYMTMWAPGSVITVWPGRTGDGTSFSAPFISGAVATLKSAAPNASADDVLAALTRGGHPVTDKATKITKPRLDVAASLAMLKDGALLRVNGSARAVGSRAVSLSLSPLKPADGAAWCAGESPDAAACCTLVPVASNITFQIQSPGDGAKALYAFMRASADCGAALLAATSTNVTLDTTPPSDVTVTVVANATAHASLLYVTTTKLTIVVTASDASPITQMCVSVSASAKGGMTQCKWVPFNATSGVKIKAYPGNHTIRVALRDAFGAEAAGEAGVVYDKTAPKISGFTGAVSAGGGEIQLSWKGSDDASGIEQYVLLYRPGTTYPAKACATSAGDVPVPVPPGPDPVSANVTGLAPGAYAFRLCAHDRAGNVAAGVTWRSK